MKATDDQQLYCPVQSAFDLTMTYERDLLYGRLVKVHEGLRHVMRLRSYSSNRGFWYHFCFYSWMLLETAIPMLWQLELQTTLMCKAVLVAESRIADIWQKLQQRKSRHEALTNPTITGYAIVD